MCAVTPDRKETLQASVTAGIRWAWRFDGAWKPAEDPSDDPHAEGVISSQASYMIGEFCPKVFALNNHPVSRTQSPIAEFGAEMSARTVTEAGYPLCSQEDRGRSLFVRATSFLAYFLSLNR